MGEPKHPLPERREFSRVSVAMRVEITAGGKTVFSSHLKNISMGGLFLISPEKLPLGSDCQMAIFLEDPKRQDRITARGKIVRVTEEGMAIHFEEIIGPESYHHLRNLVLYNALDAEKLEKEIEDRIGMKRQKR